MNEYILASFVYIGGTLLVLWLWYLVVRRLPDILAIMLWIIMFALLATPSVSDGVNAKIAPALVGMLFGIITKEKFLIYSNLSSILFVMAVCCVVAFIWLRMLKKPT